MEEEIKKSIQDSVNTIKNIEQNISQIITCINKISECLENNNKIILFGNGGSAADAQHIAAEFIGRFSKERKSLPAISLTANSSNITAISNDYSFDAVFSRQCESLVDQGDVVIGISTSGNSKNVIQGLLSAKEKGGYTIGLLGNDGGEIKTITDSAIIVNSKSTPRIQEAHRVIYHIICDHLEKQLEIL